MKITGWRKKNTGYTGHIVYTCELFDPVKNPEKAVSSSPKSKSGSDEAPESAEFPKSLGKLERTKSLGGSTGAKLVKDPDTGQEYVMKKGKNPEQLKEEITADKIYQLMGIYNEDIRVPEFKEYDKDGKIRKLSKFIKGTPLSDIKDPQLRKDAINELKSGFVLDALSC